MRCTSAFALLASLSVSALGCAPELVRTHLSPDNAGAKERAAIDGNKPAAKDASKLEETPVSADDFASLVKGDLAPVCRVEGGKAAAGSDLDSVTSGIASWTRARGNVQPGAATASSQSGGGSASVSVSASSETVTSPATGKEKETRSLLSLGVDCTGARPVVTVNGEARPVDVLFGRRIVGGVNLGATGAEPTVAVFLAGWDAQKSELVAVRAMTKHKSELKNLDAKRWNGFVVKALPGYVPNGASPTTARWMLGEKGYSSITLAFVDAGRATLVRAPVSYETVEAEGVELVRIKKK